MQRTKSVDKSAADVNRLTTGHTTSWLLVVRYIITSEGCSNPIVFIRGIHDTNKKNAQKQARKSRSQVPRKRVYEPLTFRTKLSRCDFGMRLIEVANALLLFCTVSFSFSRVVFALASCSQHIGVQTQAIQSLVPLRKFEQMVVEQMA